MRRIKKRWLVTILLIFIAGLFIWTHPKLVQSGTIKIYDRNNILLYEAANGLGKKQPVSYEELPPYLIDAVVAFEDKTFWTNWGVDGVGILRAIIDNIRANKIVSGASTITQQLARSAVISPGKIPSRNIFRKIREIVIALRLTVAYSKKEILTMYLNSMYFGNLSYGVEAASQTYFGKTVKQLSLAESTFLTGLISSPDALNPFINFREAKMQQEKVLISLKNSGKLSIDQIDQANQEKLTIQKNNVSIKSPHFTEFVLKEVNKLNLSAGNGLKVYTTVDDSLNSLAQDIAGFWINKLKDKHDLSNASLVMLKNDTGEILTMMGGIDYFDATLSGQVNMVTALRQPGSALKPITYATAFMKGIATPATLIYDVKKVYKTKKNEGFAPNNYDSKFHGLILAREALASSLNLPAVEILNRVGIDDFINYAKELGITTFSERERYDLSITLGGAEVTLLDLTNAYASLARGGVYKPTAAISRITDDKGKILFQNREYTGKPVLGSNSKQIAYLITDILADKKARMLGFGEKNPLVISHPAASKTGTTTDWHDNWTVGFTPDYTVGVWVGNNDNRPMREITGIVGAAPIWNQFFEEILKGKPEHDFIRPVSITEKQICKTDGKLDSEICPEKETEIFLEGSEPKEKSDIYKKVKVDIRNGLLAGNNCPPEFVSEKIFINYPAEVYTWAVENKQEVIPSDYSLLCSGSEMQNKATYLYITNPVNKSVYENSPEQVTNQGIIFEINYSADIKQVNWYVDGQLWQQVNYSPFSAKWELVIGKHTLWAEGISNVNNKIKSNRVEFQVID